MLNALGGISALVIVAGFGLWVQGLQYTSKRLPWNRRERHSPLAQAFERQGRFTRKFGPRLMIVGAVGVLLALIAAAVT